MQNLFARWKRLPYRGHLWCINWVINLTIYHCTTTIMQTFFKHSRCLDTVSSFFIKWLIVVAEFVLFFSEYGNDALVSSPCFLVNLAICCLKWYQNFSSCRQFHFYHSFPSIVSLPTILVCIGGMLQCAIAGLLLWSGVNMDSWCVLMLVTSPKGHLPTFLSFLPCTSLFISSLSRKNLWCYFLFL